MGSDVEMRSPRPGIDFFNCFFFFIFCQIVISIVGDFFFPFFSIKFGNVG